MQVCQAACGRLSRVVLLILMVTVFSPVACATIEHTRIVEGKDDSATGIRYLGTSPYLIAYSDGKGGIVTDLKYLPDPAKMMSAQPIAKLADAGTTMEFDRGVLTSAQDSGDATAVSKAVVEGIKAIAPSLLAAMNQTKEEAGDGYTIPAPYVFKIVVRSPDVYFLGAKGDTPIKITLLPQTAKEK